MAEIHINVGIVALSRGLISLEAFARGMQTLATAKTPTVREVWSGVLDEHQLETLLSAVTNGGKARDTMLISRPVSVATPTVPATPITTPARPPSNRPMVPAGPATAPTDAALSPATVITSIDVPATPLEAVGNRYKAMFVLGKGGLGEVTACEDLMLGRTVAVKAGYTKHDSDAYSSKVILAREARIISSLEHPNIIPIYDAGIDPTRGPYYVMRQVTETSLEMILHHRKIGDGLPHDYTLHRLLRYFLQICNAVDYAHHRGVIHCDIKPANILLGEYGEVLLVDWGLAQSRNHPLGVRGGTLGYMAPEQMDPTHRALRRAHRRLRARRDPVRDPVRQAGVRGRAQLRPHDDRQRSVQGLPHAAAAVRWSPRARASRCRASSRTSACARSRSLASERLDGRPRARDAIED